MTQIGSFDNPKRRWAESLAATAALFAAATFCYPHAAEAQIVSGLGRTMPSGVYYSGFAPFYDGKFDIALKGFQNAGRTGIKNPQSRWIDSICYHAMIGETYYQMGQFDAALDQYAAALRLYVRFSAWLNQVQFPPQIQTKGVLSAVVLPWGKSNLAASITDFPRTMQIHQGQLNFNPDLISGQPFQSRVMIPITPQEIIRCTALSMRRRRTIMGPVCEHDQLTKDVLTALLSRPGPPNHWSEAWIDLQLGIAYACAGKTAQAAQSLEKAILLSNQMVHPLTCVAQMELGRLAAEEGNLAMSTELLGEATYTAAIYEDIGVLEEAFRLGSDVHLASGTGQMYPPLVAASAWAGKNRYRQLQVSVLISAAENYATLGQTAQAAAALSQANGMAARTDLWASSLGPRMRYVQAFIAVQQGKLPEAATALAAAVKQLRVTSPWLYQINLADALYRQGLLNERRIMPIFSELLRDPTPRDWTLQPLDSIAVMAMPSSLPFEHWFGVALARRDESSLEIADRLRRRRFFSALPMGGRLLAFRWVLAAPESALGPDALIRRHDILARYPQLQQMLHRSQELVHRLRSLPLFPAAEADLKDQQALFAELVDLARRQETLIRELAIRREPCELVFPPTRTLAEIKEGLKPGQAILVFVSTTGRDYAYFITADRHTEWQITSAAIVKRSLAELLQKWGNYDANREIGIDVLNDDTWMETAAQLLTSIMEGSEVTLTEGIEELIVVPDDYFWYVPFEGLIPAEESDEDDVRPMISRFAIRYAPTASLAVPDRRPRNIGTRLGVVAGKLYPRDRENAAQDAFLEIQSDRPEATIMRVPIPEPSSAFAILIDQLAVLDDITNAKNGALGWSPLPLRSRGQESLADWLALPWGAPELVVLPGFHSAAESALKRRPTEGTGNELFLAACGLMATGTRTAVLSRWRTGGESAFDITRQFLAADPSTSPAQAWRQVVEESWQENLVPDNESRVRRLDNSADRKRDHPFFWAGYMVIDSGDSSATPDRSGGDESSTTEPPVGLDDQIEEAPDGAATPDE